jgi:hypothetical protein
MNGGKKAVQQVRSEECRVQSLGIAAGVRFAGENRGGLEKRLKKDLQIFGAGGKSRKGPRVTGQKPKGKSK